MRAKSHGGISMLINKTVTPAQIEANQRNAKLSTGPITEEGKQNASQNAVKHGLLSAVAFIHDAEERFEDFQEFKKSIADSHRPEGPVESSLTELIAFDFWRLARAAKLESWTMAEYFEDLGQVPVFRTSTLPPSY